MKNILFVRHGQSTGNVNIPAEDHTLIPLTELGHQQAKAVSQKFELTPDIIIVSPYLRARQTTEPTIILNMIWVNERIKRYGII